MRIASLLLSSITLFLAGCLATSSGPRTTIAVPVAAGSAEAARIKNVAVLPFDGDYNRELTADLEGILTGVRLGNAPYFAVADRKALDIVLKEIRLSQSGIVNKEQGLRLGKLLGIQAYYSGSVTSPAYHQNYYQESRIRCAEEDSKKGFLGFAKCKRWAETKISCTKAEAVYSFTPKLVDVETGRIVYSENIRGTSAANFCSDHAAPAPSRHQLVRTAKENALAAFRGNVAPSFVVLEIQLMSSAEGIGNDQAKRKLRQGLEFAKSDRFDRACELWQEANDLSASFVSSIYNLGICAERTGDYQTAAELYGRADRLLELPDERISASLVRIERTRQQSLKVGEQYR